MDKLFLYSVSDKCIDKYNVPFAASCDAEAIRSYKIAVNKCPFPEDLELFYIGIFDIDNGFLIPENLRRVFTYQDFIKSLESNDSSVSGDDNG